jgi:hypothetical protein
MTTSTLAGQQHREAGDGLLAAYAPGEDRPLVPYVGLMTLYGAAVTAAGVAVRRRGDPLPRLTLGDVSLIGVATYKLSRTVSKNSITSMGTPRQDSAP